jgi:hypothetical protein
MNEKEIYKRFIEMHYLISLEIAIQNALYGNERYVLPMVWITEKIKELEK